MSRRKRHQALGLFPEGEIRPFQVVNLGDGQWGEVMSPHTVAMCSVVVLQETGEIIKGKFRTVSELNQMIQHCYPDEGKLTP